MMAEEEQISVPYDPEKDCSTLKECFKDEKEEKEAIKNIVTTICHRSNAELQQLKESYYSNYREDLTEQLAKKLSGKLKNLIIGLMSSSVDYDAKQLYLTMKGAGTNEAVLNEIIISRSSSQMKKIIERYPSVNDNHVLKDDIIGDTSKEYKNLLLAMIAGGRSENPYPNREKMKQKIAELRDSKGKINRDSFVIQFANCSFGEICALCRIYENENGKSLINVIDDELSGDFKDLLKDILCYISDSGRFFAQKINKFKEEDIFRIMISRSEVDMDEIRDAYKDLYKKELVEAIQEKYSDNLKEALLILAKK